MSDVIEELVRRNRLLEQRVEGLESQEAMTFSAKPSAAAVIMSTYLAIPGLVGLWPQGFVNGASPGSVVDLTNNDGDMSNVTDVNWTRGGTDLSPPTAYVSYGNSGGHFFQGKDLAQFGILGNESWNASASAGLTIGGWFLPTNAIGFQMIFTKWETVTASKSYALVQGGTGGENVGFYIYNAGNITVLTTGNKFANSSGFHFVVGRFDPGVELKVWRNRETKINTTSIPATIQSGTGRIAIGARGDGTNDFGGRGGICFLSNQYVEDEFIDELYQVGRGYYRPTVEW